MGDRGVHGGNGPFRYAVIRLSMHKMRPETGYDQGVFGGIIITPNFLETMGNPNASLQGAIVALYDIGW
jgi:hypothetical protein